MIDPLQGKHIPVKPGKALKLFDALADTFINEYKDEDILLIGFAETATAIGAEAAIRLGARYIQTTREMIPGVEYLFFSETHSHATEQKLVKDDIDKVIDKVSRVIFIEDEVTTGNTIINIINIMEELYGINVKFSVASILNGMTEEHLKIYRERGIRVHYILKINHEEYGRIAEEYHENGNYEACDISSQSVNHVNEVSFGGWADTRRLVDASDYEKYCKALWKDIESTFALDESERILVIGTEEFMYPALFVAAQMEKKGCAVRCHSTTRSPIAVSTDHNYPLQTRYELRSLYDKDRVTYIYDIDSYDRVFIITDAHSVDKAGINSLVHAIEKKNRDVNLVRWC